MDNLFRNIRTNFGQGMIPYANDVVIRNGFDLLLKKRAAIFFMGKSWIDILEHLKGLKYELFGAAYYLDEWTVLSPKSLSYYARAYFEFLIEQLENNEPDEEYVFYFIGELYQIVYMHKGSPFSNKQTKLLIKLVEYTNIKVENKKYFEYFSEDIKNNIEEYFNELKKHKS